MFKLFPFLLISLVYSCNESNKESSKYSKHQLDSIEYIRQTVSFLNQIKNESLNDSGFILIDSTFSFEYLDCIHEVLSDNIYSKEEKSLFQSFIKSPQITKWTHEIIPKIKIVSYDSIESTTTIDSLEIISYNTFSSPFFFNNYSYCLFYSDNVCGLLCGSGKLSLYERKDNKWVLLKSYCKWIS